jgi:glycosyltransferase involved in cell wall biosynthesis
MLANSHWTKETTKNKYHRDSIIVPYGIDHELFRPSEQPLLKKQFPSIGFVWFDAEWKGSINVPYAAIIIDKEFAKTRLIAIAASIPQNFIGYEDMIMCVQPRQESLRDIYSSADVFVSSSTFEGFGLPGLEAMACGVPVVTTDSGGVREYAIHDETAVLVTPKEPEALAAAIIRVLKDEKLRQRLIKNGLKKVKEFDWEKSIDLLEKIFIESPKHT